MRCVLLLGAALLSVEASAQVPSRALLKPRARPIPRVVVLRRPGLRVYQQVAEEFRERVPATVQVDATPTTDAESARLVHRLSRTGPRLIFAIGQSAYDFANKEALPFPLIHTLVPHADNARHYGISAHVPALAVFQSFAATQPRIRRIAALHGPRTAARVARAAAVAAQFNLDLISLSAASPAEALRKLRQLPRQTGGLWLVTDLDVLAPQVVQYVVGLQFRRRLPLMGATRRQVEQGALFAVDYSPQALGQLAAVVANRLLGRRRGRRRLPTGPEAFAPRSVRLTVNLRTARQLGIPLARLSPLGPEAIQ